MQTLNDFKAEYIGPRAFKPDSQMLERWQGRIVPQGIDRMGAAGAQYYLSNYGKGIGLDKLVKLARTSEHFDAQGLAYGFWRAAYEMANGAPPPSDGNDPVDGADDGKQVLRDHANEKGVEIARAHLAEFPTDMQPGWIVTMQPVDARYDRSYYIASGLYCGQPKRDGKRTLAFVTPNLVVTQARSHTIGSLPPAISVALSQAAKSIGPFIVDGELWYADAEGGEHRTGAQAATTNQELGLAQTLVRPMYAIFDCLFAGGDNLRTEPFVERVRSAEIIAEQLESSRPIEYLAPVYSTYEKTLLADQQKANSREGEVWRLLDAPYTGGKITRDPEPITRTKYIVECTVVVTGFTPTKAEKDPTRRFAAIQVVDLETGEPLGEVGTGFTRTDQDRLLKMFEAIGRYPIVVASQGRTEGGKLWLPRFVDFADEESL